MCLWNRARCYACQHRVRLKLTLGGFLLLMLVPSTYLYLRLAFPDAAANLLPLHSMAIWMYGPLLFGILQPTSHRQFPS